MSTCITRTTGEWVGGLLGMPQALFLAPRAAIMSDLPTYLLPRYILDHEPNQFIAIYYRGQNDAWTGYGGGVVYTR